MVINKKINFDIDIGETSNVSQEERELLLTTEFIKELCSQPHSQIELNSIQLKNIENLILIGFGGSTLGTKSIFKIFPELLSKKTYTIDNLDSEEFNKIFEDLNINQTMFLFISKSGNTFEVITLFNEVLKKINSSENVFFITDTNNSKLNKIAKEKNIKVFDVNKELGGRFSVLSKSTYIPCQINNFNWLEMHDGALNFLETQKKTNFILIESVCNFLINNYRNGKNILCLMPYDNHLDSFSEWLMQLIGESIGKENLGGYSVGLTPIKYLGPKDQHSQMQLILDGPKDKVVFLLSSKKSNSINKSIDDANLLELNATEAALKEKHIPTLKMEIEDMSPADLGSLFIMFELIITLIGIRLGINPFDQPAVELIKKRLP